MPSPGPESESSTRRPASSADPGGARARYRIAAVGAVVVLGLDQLTKQVALSALADGPTELIGSLRFKLAFNSGTAFSLGSGRGGLISLLGLVAVLVLLRSVLQWPGKLPAVAAGAVAGGALGNLLDRFLRDGSGGLVGGHVVDFIDLQWWPVFNVADIGIVCGAIGLALLSFRAELADAAPVDAERPS